MDKKESEKQLDDIKLERGRTATNFAFIESVMARIITRHYFGNNNDEFIADVLEDEYFNFGLLVKIFKKIILKKDLKFPTNKLYRLPQLRNIIVHSQIITKANMIKGTSKILDIDEIKFKHGGEEYNINDIFKEYSEVEVEIRDALSKIPGGEQQKVDFL